MHENAQMWSEIMREFADSPSQERVVRFLLENGLGISPGGRVTCNRIAIPATQVAAAVGVDRRVVDATAKGILEDPQLAPIFSRMRATPDLSMVAAHLGLSVITIIPDDARSSGIVASAVRVMDAHHLAIRQIFVTDPYLAEEPKLVVIVDGTLPPGVVDELRSLPQVRRIIL
jgi:predicted regulator of amino acid metabolism with ACT domain